MKSPKLHDCQQAGVIKGSGVGRERYKADIRQFGGMLFALSTCLTMAALPISSIVAGDGKTPLGSEVSETIGGCVLCLIGIMGMLVGYLELIGYGGNTKLTCMSIAMTQLAWIPYLGEMIKIGAVAKSNIGSFGLLEIGSATSYDTIFVGSMGILSVLSYGASFVGSVAFMEFAIYAYQSGKPFDRPASYYRSRSLYYNLVLAVAGVSQLSLGYYLLMFYYGVGPLPKPIITGHYVVFFPEISVFVGLVQVVVATFGMLRTVGIGLDESDINYQAMCLFMWICMLLLQLIVQVSYDKDVALVVNETRQGCMFLSLALTPAYMDTMMRHAQPDSQHVIEYYTEYHEGPSMSSSSNLDAKTNSEGCSSISEEYDDGNYTDRDNLSEGITNLRINGRRRSTSLAHSRSNKLYSERRLSID